MKVIEAIDRIDRYKPNVFSVDDKIRWLSQFDGKVNEEIIKQYIGGESSTFTPYSESVTVTDPTTGTTTTVEPMQRTLLVPFPYDDVYIYWLEAQIDYFNNEMDRYNNSITLCDNAYSAFKTYYGSSHLPISATLRIKYFGGDENAVYNPLEN